MKTGVRLWLYFTEIFPKLEVFQKILFIESNQTFYVQYLSSPKSCSLSDNVEKHCRAVRATDGNMAHARYMLGT